MEKIYIFNYNHNNNMTNKNIIHKETLEPFFSKSVYGDKLLKTHHRLSSFYFPLGHLKSSYSTPSDRKTHVLCIIWCLQWNIKFFMFSCLHHLIKWKYSTSIVHYFITTTKFCLIFAFFFIVGNFGNSTNATKVLRKCTEEAVLAECGPAALIAG